MKYRHYSFDLWLTLIKSNPEFKIERAKYLHAHYNPMKLPLSDINTIIKDVDNTCNTINEIYGGSIHALEMYLMVLARLGFPIRTMSKMDIIAVYHYIEGIFFKYPPQFFSDDTLPTLIKIKEKGATMSILSNTGFITGKTIERAMHDHLRLPDKRSMNQLFAFTLYSDEMGTSKPSKTTFQLVEKLCGLNGIKSKDILHVGDNHHADEWGAKQAGINSMIINSELSQYSIKDLLIL